MYRKVTDLKSRLQSPENHAETCGHLLDLWMTLPESERQRQFLTTSDAAQLVGRSQRTIQMWVLEGKIQAVHVGSKYEIHVKSLKDYLRLQMNGSNRQ